MFYTLTSPAYSITRKSVADGNHSSCLFPNAVRSIFAHLVKKLKLYFFA